MCSFSRTTEATTVATTTETTPQQQPITNATTTILSSLITTEDTTAPTSATPSVGVASGDLGGLSGTEICKDKSNTFTLNPILTNNYRSRVSIKYYSLLPVIHNCYILNFTHGVLS